MFKVIITVVVLSFLAGTVFDGKSDKKLLYKDATYEFEIRTVQLHPSGGGAAELAPSVAPINNNNLILEFDDLVQSQENYRVRIINCNHDWSPSGLKNLDYLYDYNEFNIDKHDLSVDTKISYVHYTFKVPNVKLPGNYLLVVYRGDDESDLILSKRFMIYSNQVSIKLLSNLIGLSSIKRTNQQLDFAINYEDYSLQNPSENVSIVIRQNERWDNAITALKPSFVRENINELEYRFFNFQNNFNAGNEFRFFDMRSLRYPGQNVQRTDYHTRPTTVDIMVDKPRIYQPYTQYDELNGDYYIANTDTGYGKTQSDYVNVKFTLATDKLTHDIYVVGEMNNWEHKNKMSYDKSSQTYHGEIILKQGYYDYQYYVEGDTVNVNYLEGNHFETENDYEILVYYKPPSMRTDLLLGYGFYTMNPAE